MSETVATIASLNEQIAKLKADQKKAREAEKAAKEKEREENEKVRAKVQGEVDKLQKEYDAAKAKADSAKEALVAARAKLPKGTRGSGDSAWSTWSPFGGPLGLRPSAVAVLTVLNQKNGFTPIKGVRQKVAETGAKMHHSGQIYFEGPTLNGLEEAKLIEKKVIPSTDLDGGRSERAFAITKAGKDRLAKYRTDAKAAEKNGQ